MPRTSPRIGAWRARAALFDNLRRADALATPARSPPAFRYGAGRDPLRYGEGLVTKCMPRNQAWLQGARLTAWELVQDRFR